VPVEFQVIVDVDPDVGLPERDLEAARRQRPQRRPIELTPERAARAVEARERPVVEPREPLVNRLVGFGPAKSLSR
jgi:hypothetical protein